MTLLRSKCGDIETRYPSARSAIIEVTPRTVANVAWVVLLGALVACHGAAGRTAPQDSGHPVPEQQLDGGGDAPPADILVADSGRPADGGQDASPADRGVFTSPQTPIVFDRVFAVIVHDYYDTLLEKSADSKDLARWARDMRTRLEQGDTLEDVLSQTASSFIDSSEFKMAPAPDAEPSVVIADWFQTFLGRAPDAATLNDDTQLWKGAPTGWKNVLAAILSSPEYYFHVIDSHVGQGELPPSPSADYPSPTGSPTIIHCGASVVNNTDLDVEPVRMACLGMAAGSEGPSPHWNDGALDPARYNSCIRLALDALSITDAADDLESCVASARPGDTVAFAAGTYVLFRTLSVPTKVITSSNTGVTSLFTTDGAALPSNLPTTPGGACGDADGPSTCATFRASNSFIVSRCPANLKGSASALCFNDIPGNPVLYLFSPDRPNVQLRTDRYPDALDPPITPGAQAVFRYLSVDGNSSGRYQTFGASGSAWSAIGGYGTGANVYGDCEACTFVGVASIHAARGANFAVNGKQMTLDHVLVGPSGDRTVVTDPAISDGFGGFFNPGLTIKNSEFRENSDIAIVLRYAPNAIISNNIFTNYDVMLNAGLALYRYEGRSIPTGTGGGLIDNDGKTYTGDFSNAVIEGNFFDGGFSDNILFGMSVGPDLWPFVGLDFRTGPRLSPVSMESGQIIDNIIVHTRQGIAIAGVDGDPHMIGTTIRVTGNTIDLTGGYATCKSGVSSMIDVVADPSDPDYATRRAQAWIRTSGSVYSDARNAKVAFGSNFGVYDANNGALRPTYGAWTTGAAFVSGSQLADWISSAYCGVNWPTHLLISGNEVTAVQARINMERTIEVEELVTDLYTLYLARAPDPDGFEHWTNQIYSHAMSRDQVIGAFACAGVVSGACPWPQQATYITWVFRQFLGRSPEHDEVDGWSQKTATLYAADTAGTRSSQFYADLAHQFANDVDVDHYSPCTETAGSVQCSFPH